jgi:hypothetical protein
LHHGVLHRIQGVGLMPQRNLCDPECLAFDLGQEGFEAARSILGRLTQMCFPEREQIGCLWTKSSKREHRGAPTRLNSWLMQQNGAELDLVDTVSISGNATKIIHLLDAHEPTVMVGPVQSSKVSLQWASRR